MALATCTSTSAAPNLSSRRCSRTPIRSFASSAVAPRIHHDAAAASAKRAAAVLSIWKQHVESSLPATQQPKDGLLSSLSQMSCFATILPLASTTMSSQGEIYYALAKAVDIYSVVLTVRVLLTWFRQIDWSGEPWSSLRQLTDPYLNVFRGIIPALGGIDLSPILAFFLLSFVSRGLKSMAWAI